MSKTRDSFIFYRSFYEAINEFPEENQLEIYKAISEFSLNQTEPKLSGISKTIWILIKPQLEANNKKFINGIKPKKTSKPEAKDKQIGSKPEGNVNANDNVNENTNVNDNENDHKVYYFDIHFLKEELLITKLKANLKITDEQFKECYEEFIITNYLEPLNAEEYIKSKAHFLNWTKKKIKSKPLKETPEEREARKQEAFKTAGLG